MSDSETVSTDRLCGICGGTEIVTDYDVGWDIDPSGDERQHLDTCRCGAWRFNIDRIENFTTPIKVYGTWHKKDT